MGLKRDLYNELTLDSSKWSFDEFRAYHESGVKYWTSIGFEAEGKARNLKLGYWYSIKLWWYLKRLKNKHKKQESEDYIIEFIDKEKDIPKTSEEFRKKLMKLLLSDPNSDKYIREYKETEYYLYELEQKDGSILKGLVGALERYLEK